MSVASGAPTNLVKERAIPISQRLFWGIVGQSPAIHSVLDGIDLTALSAHFVDADGIRSESLGRAAELPGWAHEQLGELVRTSGQARDSLMVTSGKEGLRSAFVLETEMRVAVFLLGMEDALAMNLEHWESSWLILDTIRRFHEASLDWSADRRRDGSTMIALQSREGEIRVMATGSEQESPKTLEDALTLLVGINN